MFNVGVELGQLAIILLAYFLLAKWFSDKSYYRSRSCDSLSILSPVSLLFGRCKGFSFV
jgi:hypothetical protein